DAGIAEALGLNTWESEGNIEEGKRRIIQCFKNLETNLNLSDLELTTPPPPFCLILLSSHLTSFDFDNNRLMDANYPDISLYHLKKLIKNTAKSLHEADYNENLALGVVRALDESEEGLTPLSMRIVLNELKKTGVWPAKNQEIIRKLMVEKLIGKDLELTNLSDIKEKMAVWKDPQEKIFFLLEILPLKAMSSKEIDEILQYIGPVSLEHIPLSERIEILNSLDGVDPNFNLFQILIVSKDLKRLPRWEDKHELVSKLAKSRFAVRALFEIQKRLYNYYIDWNSKGGWDFKTCLSLEEKFELVKKVPDRKRSMELLDDQLGFGEYFKMKLFGLDSYLDLFVKMQVFYDHDLGVLNFFGNRYNLNCLSFVSEKSSLEERLSVVAKVAERGCLPISRLRVRFQELGFLEDIQKAGSLEKKIDILNLIARSSLWAEYMSKDCLYKTTGIIKALQALNSLEDRVRYCRDIAHVNHGFISALRDSFEEIGFVEDLLKIVNPEERMQVVLQLARDPWAAAGIIKFLKQIKIQDASLNLRLDLALQITRQGGEAQQELRKVFLKDPFVRDFAMDRIIHLASLLNLNRESFLDKDNNPIEESPLVRQVLIEIDKNPERGHILTSICPSIRPIHEILLYPSSIGPIPKSMYADFLNFLEENPRLASFFNVFIDHLEKIVNRTKEVDRQYVYSELLKVAVYTIGVFYDQNQEKVETLLQNPDWIVSILEYQRPNLRYSLMRQLSYLPITALRELSPKTPLENIRSLILLSRLESLGVLDSEEKKQIYRAIAQGKFFKDHGRQTSLHDFLLEVVSLGVSFLEEKNLLNTAIKTLLSYPIGKNNLINIRLLNQINGIFGREAFLSALQQRPSNYKVIFMNRFRELFSGLEEISDLSERFENTFAKFRNPGALFTYLGRVNQLSEPSRSLVKTSLSQYVASVLNGTFHELRYNMEDQPNLKRLFGNDPMALEKWRMVEEAKPVIFENSSDVEEKTIKEFLKDRVNEGHLAPLSEYPLFQSYLDGVSFDLTMEFPEDPKTKIQLALIDLCEGRKTLQEFMDTKPSISLGELDNDIQALIQRSAFQITSNLMISETDDPCDLLLIGTEIQGSCQRVDGTPNLNRGLVGYLLNGDVKAIVIKNKAGQMVARAIMRRGLIGEAPVILLERIYNNLRNSAIEKEIVNWAIRKAKRGGLSLVSKEIGFGAPCKLLEILKGRAPFVYSDAARGILSESCEISDCHFLYKALS
ncbi:MAG: hypothetical protein JSS09_06490, partial [Verrucomicrobia bacterium]|nr:hypothetical protein [Verrucomicrobiota bacterium]